MPKPVRIILTILLVLVLLGMVLWRVKRQFVPDGARITPFLFHSTEPQSLTSPGGRTLFYRFNDAGAMHSGYHWTYLYTDHWFFGKRLALAGYSTPKVRNGEVPLPITWLRGDSFIVEFATDRHDPTSTRKSGVLP